MVFDSTLTTNVPVEWLVFFFVFASVFGILTSAGSGRDSRGLFKNNAVNVVISLVFAFFAAGDPNFLRFFEANFGLMVWVFVGLFLLAFLLEVFGIRRILVGREEMKKEAQSWIVIGAIVLLLMVTVGFAQLSNLDVPIIGTNNALMILGILFFLWLVSFALHTGETAAAEKAGQPKG